MGGATAIAAICSLVAALALYHDRVLSGGDCAEPLCNCGNRYGPQHVTVERGVRCKLCGRLVCPTPGQAHEFFLRCTLISFYAAAAMILVALPSAISFVALKTFWLIPVFLLVGIVVFRLICAYTPVGRWHDLIMARLDAIDRIRAEESWDRFRSRHAAQLSDLSPDEESKIEEAVATSSVFRKDPVNEVLAGVGTIISGVVLILGALFVMSFMNMLPNDHVLARYILLWYGAWSLFTFAAMYCDKSRASRGSNSRISERQLHFYEMMGGFPGSLAAQWMLRHKVRKFSYQVVFYLIAVVHLCTWSWLLIRQW